MLQPGQILGNYTIQQELNPGGGAFGHAYKVLNNSDSTSAVLKLCKNPSGTTEANRFRQENIILKKLTPHARIIQPLSDVIDTNPNCIYYIMEIADGDLKNHLITNYENLNETNKIEVFKNICEGVKHAHSQQVIHRDLHWGNILIKKENSVDEPKLSDFGKAKDFTSSVVSSTNIDWGWYVCPPEIIFQIWDKVPDDYVAGDIYALGLILNFIMVSLPQYPSAIRSSIELFLRPKNIQNILTIPTAQRVSLYEEWLQNNNAGNLLTFLNTPSADPKLNSLFNKIIPKLSHPDHRKRYANTDELLTDLSSI